MEEKYKRAAQQLQIMLEASFDKLKREGDEKHSLSNKLALSELEMSSLREEMVLRLEQKDKTILSLTNSLQEKETTILSFTNTILEKDESILTLTGTVEENQKKILQLSISLEECEQKLGQLRTEIVALRTCCTHKNNHIEEINHLKSAKETMRDKETMRTEAIQNSRQDSDDIIERLNQNQQDFMKLVDPSLSTTLATDVNWSAEEKPVPVEEIQEVGVSFMETTWVEVSADNVPYPVQHLAPVERQELNYSVHHLQDQAGLDSSGEDDNAFEWVIENRKDGEVLLQTTGEIVGEQHQDVDEEEEEEEFQQNEDEVDEDEEIFGVSDDCKRKPLKKGRIHKKTGDVNQDCDEITGKSRKSVCTICGAVFATFRQKKKHMEDTGHSYRFSCSVCRKSFKQKIQLQRHELHKHSEDMPYKCSRCDRRFKSQFSMQRHETNDTYHTKLQDFKPYLECPYCSKQFPRFRKWWLEQHIKGHLNVKTHPCEICGKTFLSETYMKSHVLACNNIKPFNCVFCTKRFTLKSIWKAHMRLHTGEKPYSCPMCSLPFRTNEQLIMHGKRVHGARNAKHFREMVAQQPLDLQKLQEESIGVD